MKEPVTEPGLPVVCVVCFTAELSDQIELAFEKRHFISKHGAYLTHRASMWLVFNDSGMNKGEQELGRAEKENERGDQPAIDCCRADKQDLVGEDFDEPFWIKVVKMLNSREKTPFCEYFCFRYVYFLVCLFVCVCVSFCFRDSLLYYI